jgi:ribosomal-protein-alanine N-acetyltransferase
VSALLADARVWPWLWLQPDAPTEDQIIRGLERQIAHWDRHGFGMWLLRDRAEGHTVGRGGLQWTKVEGRDAVEVGWTITPERWGQGLATELARLSLDLAQDPLAIHEVVAFTLPDNLASRRVMEKAGLTLDRDIIHAGAPHVLYRIRLTR